MSAAAELASRCAAHENVITRAFCEGGSVMYLILAVGLITLFIIVDQAISLQKLAIDKDNLNENLFSMLLRGDVKQAIAFCDKHPAPLTNVLKAGSIQVVNQRPDEEVQVAIDAAVLRETPRLERLSALLAVTGNVSVLVGLLGTIIGMIGSFKAVKAADAATKAAKLSEGISEALNCTAFGLLVAVLSIIFYGIYQHRIGRAVNDMAESSMTFMNLVVSNRDKLKN